MLIDNNNTGIGDVPYSTERAKKTLPKSIRILLFFLLGSLYVYALSLTIVEATILDINDSMIFITGFVMLLLFFIVFYNRYTLITFSTFAAVSLLIFIVRITRLKATSGTLFNIKTFLQDLYLFIRGYLPYEPEYTFPIVLFICSLIALCIFFTLYLNFYFYPLAILGITIFIFNRIANYYYSDHAFIIFLFCLFVFLCRHMNRKTHYVKGKKSSEAGQDTVFTLSIIPVCLAVIMLAYALPSVDKEGGYLASERFLQRPINAVNEFFYVIFNPKYFTFQTTGFTGRDGKLGGKISINNRGIMDVYSDSRTYLAGAVHDVYTGNSWESTDGDMFDRTQDTDSASDYIETASALADLNIKTTDIRVNIGTSRTGTIFRPLKNNGLIYEGGLDILTNPQGDMRTSSLLPSNTEYSYQFFNIDYKDISVQSLLRSSEKGRHRQLLDFAESYTKDILDTTTKLSTVLNVYVITDNSMGFIMDNPESGFSKEKLTSLTEYSDKIYEQYTKVSDTVPQRVYDLANEITNGYENDYDRVKAIEEYLSKFPYTLMPVDVPANQDFVDFFLFEGKEGYCTYYATAMAILSRCIGMPARYVEGYIMPQERGDNGAYNISNRQAHSWTEVYFEGFGWVPFEATAPFSYTFYQNDTPPGDQVFSSGFIQNPYYLEYLEQMGMRDQYYTPSILPELPVPSVTQSLFDGFITFLYLLAVVVGMLLLYYVFIGIMKLQEKLYHKKIKTFDKNRQATEYFKCILKMTRYYHYPIGINETPANYAKRIRKRFAFHNDTVFIRDLVRIYYEARYSGSELSNEDLFIIETSYFEMLRFLRSMRYQQVYLFHRYVIKII